MEMLNDEVAGKLKVALSTMKNSVKILYFTHEFECKFCKETQTFLSEVAGLNNKIKMEVFDYLKENEKAKEYGVDKIPAIVICDEKNNDTGMKFYGIPAGYEINSFVVALVEASGILPEYNERVIQRINAISKPVHIQVFISLGCPYCPDAVINAHRLALLNKNVKADMVDVTIFSYLGNKYDVSGVPKIIINEELELVGAQPIEKFLELIEKI